MSSRLSLLEHPPHLPRQVLQQLLADAGADVSGTDRETVVGETESQTGVLAVTNGDMSNVTIQGIPL